VARLPPCAFLLPTIFSTPAIDCQLRWELYHGIDCKSASWVRIAAFFPGIPIAQTPRGSGEAGAIAMPPVFAPDALRDLSRCPPAIGQAVVGTPCRRGRQAAIIESQPRNVRTSALVARASLCSI
jgi:hypothetical protein